MRQIVPCDPSSYLVCLAGQLMFALYCKQTHRICNANIDLARSFIAEPPDADADEIVALSDAEPGGDDLVGVLARGREADAGIAAPAAIIVAGQFLAGR